MCHHRDFGKCSSIPFNPTINRAGDFSAYQIDFVSTVTTVENLSELLSYKCQGQPLAIVVQIIVF